MKPIIKFAWIASLVTNILTLGLVAGYMVSKTSTATEVEVNTMPEKRGNTSEVTYDIGVAEKKNNANVKQARHSAHHSNNRLMSTKARLNSAFMSVEKQANLVQDLLNQNLNDMHVLADRRRQVSDEMFQVLSHYANSPSFQIEQFKSDFLKVAEHRYQLEQDMLNLVVGVLRELPQQIRAHHALPFFKVVKRIVSERPKPVVNQVPMPNLGFSLTITTVSPTGTVEREVLGVQESNKAKPNKERKSKPSLINEQILY